MAAVMQNATPTAAAPVSGNQEWKTTLWILFGAQLATAIGFSTINPFLPSSAPILVEEELTGNAE